MNPGRQVLALLLMNQTAVQGSRVLLALYILDYGASPLLVGLLAGTYSLFPALLSVPVGRFVDRHGARLPLLTGALFGGLGMLVPYFIPGIPSMFAGAGGISLASALYNVSLQNLMGQIGAAESRRRDFSNYSLMNSTAALFGPLLAGFSIDHIGASAGCLVIAAITLGPLSLVLSGILPMGHRKPAGGKKDAAQKGRLLDLISGTGMRRALISGNLQNCGDTLCQFYLPVYGHSIGLSASTIGMILATQAAAAFVVRILLPQMLRRTGEHGMLVYAFYLGCGCLMLVPLFTSPIALAMIAFGVGVSLGCTAPIVTMLMFSTSPPGRSGEAVGLKVTTNHIAKVVAPAIYGSIATAFGLLPVFWLTAALFGAAGRMNQAEQRAGRSAAGGGSQG